MTARGVLPLSLTTREFATFLRSERAKCLNVIKAANVKVE
jgi:hypothetical protein